MNRPLFLLLAGFGLCAGCALSFDFSGYTCSPFQAPTCSSTQSCLYNSDTSEFSCATSTGDVQSDDRCTLESDCAPGYACIKSDAFTSGHCSLYCLSSDFCLDDTRRKCLEFTVPRMAGGDTVGVCAPLDPPCEPLGSGDTGTSCSDSQKCWLVDSDYTRCLDLSKSVVTVGGECKFQNWCPRGTQCVGDGNDVYTCHVLCEYTGTATCASGTCTPFSTEVVLHDTKGAVRKIGYCK